MRTQKEWYDFCINRGTSGDVDLERMIFDILDDWKESQEILLEKIYDLTDDIEINIGDNILLEDD